MLFKHTWSPVVSSRVSSFETGALMEHFLEGSTLLLRNSKLTQKRILLLYLLLISFGLMYKHVTRSEHINSFKE